MKKRLVALGLILLMLWAAFAGLGEEAAEEFQIEGNTLVKYNGNSEEVIVPGGIEILGKGAFQWCTRIRKITLPDTLKEIQSECFRGCRSLESIRIPASVENLDGNGSYSAFGDNDVLKSIEVDPANKNYTSVGGVLFTKDKKRLVAYPEAKNANGKYAIPEGTESISGARIQGTLVSVSIPASLTEKIRPWDLNIDTLKEYTVSRDNPLYTAIKGVLYSKDETELVRWPANMAVKKLSPENIPESVTKIGDRAFEDNRNLTAVELPDRITEIGFAAFIGCGELEEIMIPASVSLIPQFLAADCEKLRFLTICNPDVVFEEYAGIVRDCKNVIVRAPAGSTTEAYCAENNIPFMDMNLTAEEMTQQQEVLNWVTDGKTLVRYIGEDTKLVIPEGIEEIGENAFYGNETILSVVFPSTLKRVGYNAFCYCRKLASVTFNEGLEEIGDDAFYGTGKLNSIRLPATLKKIGDKAFFGHGLVKTLEFPEGLEEIGKEAFWAGNDSKLKSVRFPSTLKVIGEDAFHYNDLTSVEWAEGIQLRKIPKGCFSSCKLSKVTIPEGVEEIGDQAFSSNNGLKKIIFPSTLKKIGERAFVVCGLSSLVLSEGLEEIGPYAFAYNKLTDVTVSAGVKKIGESAFCRDDGKVLSKITFLGPDTQADDCLISKYDDYTKENADKASTVTVSCYPGSTADYLYRSNVNKKYLKWSEDHTKTAPAEKVLRAGLYTPEDHVAELIIPEGVEEIGDGAFAGLVTLQKVSFPSSLKSVGARAFEGCGVLDGVKLPDGMTVIGEAAFKDCTGLAAVALPAGVAEIADESFRGCSRLAKVTMAKTGMLRIGASAFEDCKALKKIDLPESVESIGAGAFAGTGVTALKLPAGITEIPDRMCAKCSGLKSVTIPAGVTRIGKEAFTCCWELGTVQIPEGVTIIDTMAFYMDARVVNYYYYFKKTASRLNVKLPASLETIGEMAFCGCDAMGSLSFPKEAQLKEIGKQAFAVCVRLKTVKLPDTVKTIGESAFVNCVGLEKADLGKSLLEIGDTAFMHDSRMTSLTVPDTLTSIGKDLLEDCGGRKLTVTCGEDSAMERWLQVNAPEVRIKHPRK